MNKYIQCKRDYLNLEKITHNQKGGVHKFSEIGFDQYINYYEAMSHKNAYKLLSLISQNDKSKDVSLGLGTHKIVSIESLTCGMIFSTLVDVPFGGVYKYGNFGVYDTKAKVQFIDLRVGDVYTHQCAKEMALGGLKNSNATIAIAVTGNSMPSYSHKDKIGEVYMAIAGYCVENEQVVIKVETKVFYLCSDNDPAFEDDQNETCNIWFNNMDEERMLRERIELLKQSSVKCDNNKTSIDDVLKSRLLDGYNDIYLTNNISKFIRLKTVAKSLQLAYDFIIKHNIINGSPKGCPVNELNSTPITDINYIHSSLVSEADTKTRENMKDNYDDSVRLATNDISNIKKKMADIQGIKNDMLTKAYDDKTACELDKKIVTDLINKK